VNSLSFGDRKIDMSKAGGDNGWTIFGRDESFGEDQDELIGSANDDTFVDGDAGSGDNNFSEDTFTGGDGSDLFVFNVGLSEVATFETETIVPGLDIDYYDLTSGGTDTSGSSIEVTYQVDKTQYSVTLTDSNSGLTSATDLSDADAVLSAIAADINSRNGVSAEAVDTGVDGIADRIVVTATNGTSFKSIEIDESNTDIDLTFDQVLDTGVSGDDDLTDEGDDDAQVTGITVTAPVGGATGGEQYFLTITPKDNRPAIEAVYTAASGDNAEQIAAGLQDALENFVSADSVVATVTNNVITITAAVSDIESGDFGGFDVSLLEGQAVLDGSSASSLLNGEGVSTTLAEVGADLITDFMVDDDTVSFGLGAGDADNFDDGTFQETFGDALVQAQAAFANDEDLVYFFTGYNDDVSGDGDDGLAGDIGLLFVNANGSDEPDTVVALLGVAEGTVDPDNII
jgi:hypothetical protein